MHCVKMNVNGSRIKPAVLAKKVNDEVSATQYSHLSGKSLEYYSRIASWFVTGLEIV